MAPDPDEYFEHVLYWAGPGGERVERTPVDEWRLWWHRQAAATEGLARRAAGQGFVLTTGQLHASGWTANDLRREVRRGSWWCPARGTASPVVVPGDDHLDRRRQHALHAAAAAVLRPGHVVSGRSAAVLHGLPTLRVPTAAELTAADVRLGRAGATHVRGATLTAAEIGTWFGVPITTVARTLVDLARHDRRDAIMAADAALAARSTTRTAIDAAVRAATGWPGVVTAREVLPLADPRAESPLESVTRLALHDDGFPAPQPQGLIHDPRRRRPWRVDLLWRQLRLVVECDGLLKYRDDALAREKQRETRLRKLGYRVERVLWEDVLTDWSATSDRLRWALGLAS